VISAHLLQAKVATHRGELRNTVLLEITQQSLKGDLMRLRISPVSKVANMPCPAQSGRVDVLAKFVANLEIFDSGTSRRFLASGRSQPPTIVAPLLMQLIERGCKAGTSIMGVSAFPPE
jgi:hypothetical protein